MLRKSRDRMSKREIKVSIIGLNRILKLSRVHYRPPNLQKRWLIRRNSIQVSFSYNIRFLKGKKMAGREYEGRPEEAKVSKYKRG